jgi:hypothetical protein
VSDHPQVRRPGRGLVVGRRPLTRARRGARRVAGGRGRRGRGGGRCGRREARARGWEHRNPTGALVCPDPRENRVDIGGRRVVGIERRPQIGLDGEVGAARAKVLTGRQRGVVHVVRVLGPIGIAVHAIGPPRPRQELHRPDRVIPSGVAVIPAAIRVAHRGERRTDDRGHRGAIAAQVASGGVLRLHPADPGEHLPGQTAARRTLSHRVRGRDIGGEHIDRNAQIGAGKRACPCPDRVRGVRWPSDGGRQRRRRRNGGVTGGGKVDRGRPRIEGISRRDERVRKRVAGERHEVEGLRRRPHGGTSHRCGR